MHFHILERHFIFVFCMLNICEINCVPAWFYLVKAHQSPEHDRRLRQNRNSVTSTVSAVKHNMQSNELCILFNAMFCGSQGQNLTMRFDLLSYKKSESLRFIIKTVRVSSLTWGSGGGRADIGGPAGTF